MKYTILFTSKNNYDLLENWISKYSNYDLPNIINLDLGSDKEEVEKGKRICSQYSIKYIKSQRTEFQHNIYQVFTNSKDSENDFILYLHQDCFPASKLDFRKINDCIIKNDLTTFGCIGFNNYHDIEISHFNSNQHKYMTTSRCVLQKGNGYYMRYPDGSKVNYDNFEITKPFSVENVMWTSLLISKKSFLKNIKVDLDFNFFLSPDDLAYQFLSRGIHNMVFPHINFIHDQSIKTKYKLPKDSPLGKIDEVEAKYGRLKNINKIWKKKWGFTYDPTKQISFFNNRYVKFFMLIFFKKIYINLETKSRFQYRKWAKKPRLFNMYYNHDPMNGPLKYFNLNI